VKSIPVETILTSPLVESVPQRTPSSAEPDPNEDSDLIESNIDLSKKSEHVYSQICIKDHEYLAKFKPVVKDHS
jgi:hypothetical protein